jgi:phosphate/sulfate permease
MGALPARLMAWVLTLPAAATIAALAYPLSGLLVAW